MDHILLRMRISLSLHCGLLLVSYHLHAEIKILMSYFIRFQSKRPLLYLRELWKFL